MDAPLPAAPSWTPDLAWADLGQRSRVAARGLDAGRFVESFATASVVGLAPGHGTETFFTDARGWVIALATALRVDDGLLIDAEPGLGLRLRDHLEHYHIREQVEITDESADYAAVLVTGTAARSWLAGEGATLPDAVCHHAATTLGGVVVRVVQADWWTACDWIVHVAAADRSRLVDRLAGAIGPAADAAEIEAARIARGTPHPADIRDKTLPQELDRDARAISFTKGCYLGQETVARLDALGHVNRRLAVVAVAGRVGPGAEVRCGAEPAGVLTSVAPLPHGEGMVGLGLLSTKHSAAAVTIDGLAAHRLGRA